MDAITKSIITKLAWDTFAFYHEKAIDIALHVYIQNELRALNKLENASDKQIAEYTDIIEATILETPEEIKNIEDNQEQKEAFEKYFKKTIKESLIDIEDSEIEIDLGDGTLEGSVKHIKNSTIKIK